MTKSIQELVGASELQDVRFFKLSGEFTVDELPDGQDFPTDDYDVLFDLQMATRADNSGLIATMSCAVSRSGTKYEVEVAGLYTVEGFVESDYPSEVIGEFGRRVAAFQLLPFLREGIADLAARLRLDVPILPLLPNHMGPGALEVGDESRGE